MQVVAKALINHPGEHGQVAHIGIPTTGGHHGQPLLRAGHHGDDDMGDTCLQLAHQHAIGHDQLLARQLGKAPYAVAATGSGDDHGEGRNRPAHLPAGEPLADAKGQHYQIHLLVDLRLQQGRAAWVRSMVIGQAQFLLEQAEVVVDEPAHPSLAVQKREGRPALEQADSERGQLSEPLPLIRSQQEAAMALKAQAAIPQPAPFKLGALLHRQGLDGGVEPHPQTGFIPAHSQM
ncbi:hypothetical protein D3C75_924250 [compost metagenome]